MIHDPGRVLEPLLSAGPKHVLQVEANRHQLPLQLRIPPVRLGLPLYGLELRLDVEPVLDRAQAPDQAGIAGYLRITSAKFPRSENSSVASGG